MVKIPKLDLSSEERMALRRQRIKISEIMTWSCDELSWALCISHDRARVLKALAEFQTIPSIGPRFAQDLIDLGYYSIEQLRDQNGADLLNQFERICGVRMDPCVEDQFRLVIDYAIHGDRQKQWWDFTEERKKYRKQFGYPVDRPR